jgi:TetR/AcrR family transcriptional regulator
MARGRSAQFDGNRESIVRTAAALFAERGYPGTSMSDLARACGISKPLLYHYVSDKYQLLLEITDGHVSRLDTLVREVEAQARALPGAARLRVLIERFLDEYAQARHDHRVLTEDVKFLDQGDRDRVLRTERAIVGAFARAVADARPALAAEALEMPLTMLLFGMMNWMFTWLRPDGRLPHDAIARLAADLFLGGLASLQPPDMVQARRSSSERSVDNTSRHAHTTLEKPR